MANAFVLSTGRCGALTFQEACRHATNYTIGLQSRKAARGDERVAYPDRHIEIDHCLAWFLGWLEKTYGDGAVYVHLTRDPLSVAESYDRRWTSRDSIPMVYARGMLKSRLLGPRPCTDLVHTVTENIEAFLAGKSRVHHIDIASPETGFRAFWSDIGAEGDLEAALCEFERRHNGGDARDSEARPDFASERDEIEFELRRVLRLLEEENRELEDERAALAHTNSLQPNVEAELAKAQSRLDMSLAREVDTQREIQYLRTSLAHRIGYAVTSNLRSPLRWAWIPFAVPKAALDYRRGRGVAAPPLEKAGSLDE